MLVVEPHGLGPGKQDAGESPEGLIASKAVSRLTGRLAGQLRLHHIQQVFHNERLL
jgi:hypothetical protein